MPDKRLREQVRYVARLRHLGVRTEDTYWNWIKRFILFHQKQHPRTLSSEDISKFLTHSQSRPRSRFNAESGSKRSRFSLSAGVKIDLPQLDSVVRAPQKRRLPVVLTREEAGSVIGRLNQDNRLIASLLYGSGLRLMEAVRLRVKDIDFARAEIRVRDGKGEQDRITMLPKSISKSLELHLDGVKRRHEQDLRDGGGDVYLPYALERKYPNASHDFGWQYVFPANKLSNDPRSGKRRRHHVLELNIQRAVKRAVAGAGIRKHATCHSFSSQLCDPFA